MLTGAGIFFVMAYCDLCLMQWCKRRTAIGNQYCSYLDSGADRTVFNADFLPLLELMALPETDGQQLGGIGGMAESIFVETRLGFTRDNGKQVEICGSFAVFTNLQSSDVSVLGRDVTDNFDVMYSFPRRQVTLLAPPHNFQINQAR